MFDAWFLVKATMQEHDSRIALRLPSEQRQKIDQLIQERKFKNLSQVIREAIDLFLSKEGQALEQFLTKQSEVSA
jgi:Arc/MetJ-type ribon-helix-helix transcriptional regulator